MHFKTTLSVIFFCLITLSILKAQTVDTQYGQVTGHMNDDVFEFLGIPFAAPPVGDLRWKPTTESNNWENPIITDQFPPKCSQKNFAQGDTVGMIEGEEDCLYLNVWSPDISGSLPVMVFIHGGGNQAGSTSEIGAGTEIYHGKNLAGRGDIVLVTIQYRLGPLGYLAHPGLEEENNEGVSGNYGVMDQIFALKWVQNNIANFGGNPGNVTIFGESGGGVNVGNLLTTSSANGLFHKAIIQSALPGVEVYDTTRKKGMAYVNEFITTGSNQEKIAYMRSLDADILVSELDHPIQGGIVQQQWRPTLDSYIFLDFPEAVFQTGNYNKVPLMLGSNSEEMSLSVPPTVIPSLVTILINTFIPPSYRDDALALYPSGTTNEEARESYISILTDAQFTNSARRTARCISKNQTEPVWRYFFTHSHHPNIPVIGELGAYHGIELFYVFNNWENSPIAIGPWFSEEDANVQDNCLRYWTNFAYNGDPNEGDLPIWPLYDANDDCYLDIKAEPDGNQCGVRATECDFWDEVSGYTGCTGSTAVSGATLDEDMYIYPNPTKGWINIQPITDQDEVVLSIFSMTGNSIYQGNIKTEIDLSTYNPGTYLIQIKSPTKVYCEKIIKVE